MQKNMRLDPSLPSHTNVSFRWITKLNVKGKMIKLFKDNRAYLHDLGVGEEF